MTNRQPPVGASTNSATIQRLPGRHRAAGHRALGITHKTNRGKSRFRVWIHVLTFTIGAVAGWAKAYRDLEKIEVERIHEITALFGKFLSQDPKERALACLLAERIDKAIAVQICKVAAADANSTVKERATRQLSRLAQDADPKIEQPAKKALLQHYLSQELSSPEIQADLERAANYAKARSPDGQERALDLYTSVLERLSPRAIAELHPGRLKRAQEAESGGFHDDAVRQLTKLFSTYLQTSDAKGGTHQ